MAAESSKETGEDQIASLIDDLIREILSESKTPSASSMRGMSATAALFETALGSEQGVSRISTLERLLLAEAFASELAEALAPALAEQLAPRLVKALQHFMGAEEAGKKPAPAGRPGSQGRKPEAK